MPDAAEPNPIADLLLNSKRRRPSILVNEGHGHLANAENDRARVVFSPPFRRLQDRTQVFALEENVSVRNRLTHSLEVAHVGRILASIACEILGDEFPAFRQNAGDWAAISQTVDTACLVHDIGNPPFGHFGEHTIREWFRRQQELKTFEWKGMSKETRREFNRRYADFLHFDGNAQGFRILTTLQRNHDEFSLNLTLMLLASAVKYPGTPDDLGTAEDGKLKKAGIFYTEEQIFRDIWKQCGLSMSERDSDGRFTAAMRHPLSYLMEAADDIAYCLSDIEDAAIKGIYDAEHVMDFLNAKSSNVLIRNALKKAERSVPQRCAIEPFPLAKFTIFRASLILSLIRTLAREFADRVKQKKLAGSPPLVDGSKDAEDALEKLKEFARQQIYSSRVVHDRELSGGVVISGILDSFKPLLLYKRADVLKLINGKKPDAPYTVEPALCSLLPRKGKAMYLHFNAPKSGSRPEEKPVSDVEEWMMRAHMVVDYVSGMTDRYALATYRQITSP